MNDHQYPVRREDISNLRDLENTFQEFLENLDEIENTITKLGEIIFISATMLSVDEDVANLCEFSRRLGSELLPAEMRANYFENNCWVDRPRDPIPLKFKISYKNATGSEVVTPEIRNAATVLYFSITLHWDPKLKPAAALLTTYIQSRKLWSYADTENVVFRKSGKSASADGVKE